MAGENFYIVRFLSNFKKYVFSAQNKLIETMKYLSLLIFIMLIYCGKKESKPIKNPSVPQQNIALLVDNSLTMIAKDFEPDRISVLKETIKNIIEHKKENQAFSIVVFAGNSYILCPLTKDKNKLFAAVNGLNRGIMKLKPGTNFSNALLNGINSLSGEFDYRSMILFSDGKETIQSYPLEIPLEDAKRNNITIHTTMITPKDFTILPLTIDSKGNFQFIKMKAKPADSALMKKISSETNGNFKLFYTKQEIQKFNFIQFFESHHKENKKVSPKINDNELSKIYKQIQKTNDSLNIIFQK
ncbi:vWA domain-containing protein [Chryseobacterium gambrini]|uniref:VWA domain-containing protein n=2 Tax=Chryseobacterium group TaxID=2782232 RepID=A0AAJ1VLF8_9FLAO|nr:vWA domain-containing protein [Chryseobacterium gambrini]MDN4014101.1 vWA domain-containing protein [Chryseobacterium gambrini]MDN4028156.1 vWA domain-containing protein [Chryseobacterium gambrini]